MVRNHSQRFSRREIFLIASLFIILFLACLIKLGGFSAFAGIRALHLEHNMIRAEMEPFTALLARESQIRAAYLETEPDRLSMALLIPDSGQYPAAIGELEKLIGNGPGSLIAMRVNEKVDYGIYSAHNISVKIGNLDRFPDELIRQLENFSQLLIIEQLEWQAEDEENSSIYLSLNLYFLNQTH